MIDRKDLEVGKKFALAEQATVWSIYHEDLPYVTIESVKDSTHSRSGIIIYVKEFRGWITVYDLDYLYAPYSVEDWNID